jgi:DNA repair protein RecN (Recombination protein N)
LYGGHRSRDPVLDGLETVVARLREIAKVDKQMENVLVTAEAVLYQLQEIGREIAGYKDHVDADPVRLENIHARLDAIERLKKKYGMTVEDVLTYHQQITEELLQLENREERSAILRQEIDAAYSQLSSTAEKLSQLRKTAAARMIEAIHKELADLGMKQAVFDVAFETVAIASGGQDRVEFLFSANPGELPRSLAKIISGGEMSRVMLALKKALADVDQIETVIFDEIDTGIGGRAAQAVAEKMAQIALVRQVLCITHLPQIACMADRHFLIRKQVQGERTFTEVTPLDTLGQQEELARMLGGAQMTDTTLKHAAEMLEIAQKQKKLWKN